MWCCRFRRRRPGLGQDQRIALAFLQFPQSRVDVAAQLDQRQIGPGGRATGRADACCRFPPWSRAVDRSTESATVETSASAGLSRCRNRRQTEAVDRLGRQILQTVNGQIDPVVEQGALDFLGEDALGAQLADRRRADIPFGLDLDQFDVGPQGAELAGNPFGLPHRQSVARVPRRTTIVEESDMVHSRKDSRDQRLPHHQEIQRPTIRRRANTSKNARINQRNRSFDSVAPPAAAKSGDEQHQGGRPGARSPSHAQQRPAEGQQPCTAICSGDSSRKDSQRKLLCRSGRPFLGQQPQHERRPSHSQKASQKPARSTGDDLSRLALATAHCRGATGAAAAGFQPVRCPPIGVSTVGPHHSPVSASGCRWATPMHERSAPAPHRAKPTAPDTAKCRTASEPGRWASAHRSPPAERLRQTSSSGTTTSPMPKADHGLDERPEEPDRLSLEPRLSIHFRLSTDR